MPNPLWKKLGYRTGYRACLIHPPEGYLDWVSPLPEKIDFSVNDQLHLVHLFTNPCEELKNELLQARGRIVQNGMIWVSWYKKASGLHSELSEHLIRTTAIDYRLVDVKVCSINDQWSALKLVIPVIYRSTSR